MSGVIRGIGHQLWGAGINFIAFYIVGLPIGIPLALFTDLKSFGMWIGLLSASLTQVIGYGIMLLCLNWKKESQLAMKRGEGDKGKKEKGGHHILRNEEEEGERIELKDYRPVKLEEEELECDEERNENEIIGENENGIEENENEDQDDRELLTDKLLEDDDDDDDKKQENNPEVMVHKSTRKSKKVKIIKILLTKGVLYLIGIIGCVVAIFTSRLTPPESIINGNFSECTDNYYLYHNTTS